LAPLDPLSSPLEHLSEQENWEAIATDLLTMLKRSITCTEFDVDRASMESLLFSIEHSATINDPEENWYIYHSDHLGSSSFLTDASGDPTQHLQYLPFGETFVEQRSVTSYYTPYTFSAKERDPETGYSYFGARYYSSDISVWLSVDPMSDKAPGWTPYRYGFNQPTLFIDRDGLFESTHTDENGNVIAVYNDGDNGVYRHKNADLKEFDPERMSLSKFGAEKMGETEYWDEFINPETGKVLTDHKIQFGRSFDPVIERMHSSSKGMFPWQIARESRTGGNFDIKNNYQNVGALLKGRYATSRSAGNFLAGYNASSIPLLSFDRFQRLAGALHIEEQHGVRLSRSDMMDIVLGGTYVSSDHSRFKPPLWGENFYQYRMSLRGWNHGSQR
jgi:RHS repeat-associated protein